eukprot:jgi/Chrzof1/7025/Cz02g08010.t1
MAPSTLDLGPSGAPHTEQTLGQILESGYAYARQCWRSANGIRVMLSLLQSKQHLSPVHANRVRALACIALLGLARDAYIRHILGKATGREGIG